MKTGSSINWVGRVAALAIAATFGVAGAARAQAPPDFTDIGTSLPNAGACAGPMDGSVWLGFCSPVWLLPMGAPEIAFGGDAFAQTGVITYDATSHVLTMSGKITGIYFNTHGNNEQMPDSRRLASSVVLRVLIGNDGKFAGGGGNACGDGGFDDFCVMGEVHSNDGAVYGLNPDGTVRPLVRGRIEHVTNKPNAITHSGVLWDDFEFYINATGGDIVNTFWKPNGFTHVLVQSFGYNGDGHVTYVGTNPFTQSFTEFYNFGYNGVTINDVGFLFDPCNGRISGAVTDYFNSLNGIPGASVDITGPSTHVVLDPDDANGGPWSSASNLCAGTYTIAVQPPAGYSTYTTLPYAASYTANITTVGNGNTSVSGVNFRLYSTPVTSAAYTTFGQAGWGAKPKGQNAASLLANYFALLYPTGELVLGVPNTVGRFTVTETGPVAIQDFLPQEGKPLPLNGNYVDPPSRFKPQHANKMGHHRKLGSLAGELLTLELNVRFSAFAITRNGLGALKIGVGALTGWTVDQVLAAGNQALGGGALPTGISYAQLEDIIERINKNFQAGTIDNGYLKK